MARFKLLCWKRAVQDSLVQKRTFGKGLDYKDSDLTLGLLECWDYNVIGEFLG